MRSLPPITLPPPIRAGNDLVRSSSYRFTEPDNCARLLLGPDSIAAVTLSPLLPNTGPAHPAPAAGRLHGRPPAALAMNPRSTPELIAAPLEGCAAGTTREWLRRCVPRSSPWGRIPSHRPSRREAPAIPDWGRGPLPLVTGMLSLARALARARDSGHVQDPLQPGQALGDELGIAVPVVRHAHHRDGERPSARAARCRCPRRSRSGTPHGPRPAGPRSVRARRSGCRSSGRRSR